MSYYNGKKFFYILFYVSGFFNNELLSSVLACSSRICSIVLNPGQLPVYHPVIKENGVNIEEQVKIFETGGAQEAFNEANKERVTSARLQHYFSSIYQIGRRTGWFIGCFISLG